MYKKVVNGAVYNNAFQEHLFPFAVEAFGGLRKCNFQGNNSPALIAISVRDYKERVVIQFNPFRGLRGVVSIRLSISGILSRER